MSSAKYNSRGADKRIDYTESSEDPIDWEEESGDWVDYAGPNRQTEETEYIDQSETKGDDVDHIDQSEPQDSEGRNAPRAGDISCDAQSCAARASLGATATDS